jgi:hypothetical protein
MNEEDRKLISEAMRLLGSRRSERKAKSSAENAEKARAKKKLKKEFVASNG